MMETVCWSQLSDPNDWSPSHVVVVNRARYMANRERLLSRWLREHRQRIWHPASNAIAIRRTDLRLLAMLERVRAEMHGDPRMVTPAENALRDL